MVSVVLAGGGTAGHTSPMIATAQALAEADCATALTCVGTPKGLETTVVPAAGLELRLIDPVPLPRQPSPDLVGLPVRLGRAVSQARAILEQADAAVVVGFGGYASLPVCLAAWRMRLPVVVHEQNAVPGLANKVSARFAGAVLTTFPGTPLRGAICVGLPLRADLTALARAGLASERAGARQEFGLRADLPVLLVSGGSQGARRLNQATLGAREELLRAGVQILHVWGPKNLTAERGLIEDAASGARYLPLGYVEAMKRAYAAADLMLSRAGAATVVETATLGLPAIVVPYPFGNGEQARNAAALVATGADELVADAELTSAELLRRVLPLITDPGELARRGALAQQVMPAGAAERVAAAALELAATSAITRRTRVELRGEETDDATV